MVGQVVSYECVELGIRLPAAVGCVRGTDDAVSVQLQEPGKGPTDTDVAAATSTFTLSSLLWDACSQFTTREVGRHRRNVSVPREECRTAPYGPGLAGARPSWIAYNAA